MILDKFSGSEDAAVRDTDGAKRLPWLHAETQKNSNDFNLITCPLSMSMCCNIVYSWYFILEPKPLCYQGPDWHGAGQVMVHRPAFPVSRLNYSVV